MSKYVAIVYSLLCKSRMMRRKKKKKNWRIWEFKSLTFVIDNELFTCFDFCVLWRDLLRWWISIYLVEFSSFYFPLRICLFLADIKIRVQNDGQSWGFRCNYRQSYSRRTIFILWSMICLQFFVIIVVLCTTYLLKIKYLYERYRRDIFMKKNRYLRMKIPFTYQKFYQAFSLYFNVL